MSDELKAARERKHRWDADDDAAYDAPGTDEENDMFMFGDAHLAEHPADEDEPITCEWLSMLTTRQQDAHLTGRFIWVIAAGRFCAFIVTFEPQGRQFLFQANGQALIVVKTRGDVRRLTTALGIDLPTRIDNTPAAK